MSFTDAISTTEYDYHEKYHGSMKILMEFRILIKYLKTIHIERERERERDRERERNFHRNIYENILFMEITNCQR